MRRSKGVVDVKVKEWRQVANEVGLGHLCGGLFHRLFEVAQLFTVDADVVEQQDLTILEVGDASSGGRAASSGESSR